MVLAAHGIDCQRRQVTLHHQQMPTRSCRLNARHRTHRTKMPEEKPGCPADVSDSLEFVPGACLMIVALKADSGS